MTHEINVLKMQCEKVMAVGQELDRIRLLIKEGDNKKTVSIIAEINANLHLLELERYFESAIKADLLNVSALIMQDKYIQADRDIREIKANLLENWEHLACK